MEINSIFAQISDLITSKNYSSFLIDPNLQHLSTKDNIVLTVFDKEGNRFNAIVFYNFEINEISPPIQDKMGLSGYYPLKLGDKPASTIDVPAIKYISEDGSYYYIIDTDGRIWTFSKPTGIIP